MCSTSSDPAQLVDELVAEFAAARAAIRNINRLTRQLRHKAKAVAFDAQAPGRLVSVIAHPTAPDGTPIKRGRGRPRGVRNGTGRLTLYVTAAQLAQLRDALRQ